MTPEKLFFELLKAGKVLIVGRGRALYVDHGDDEEHIGGLDSEISIDEALSHLELHHDELVKAIEADKPTDREGMIQRAEEKMARHLANIRELEERCTYRPPALDRSERRVSELQSLLDMLKNGDDRFLLDNADRLR